VRLAANNAQKEVYFSTQRENDQWTELQHVLSAEDAKTLDQLIATRCQKINTTQSQHKQHKLERMVAAKSPRAAHTTSASSNVVNLSSHTLSAQQEAVLSRGMGFGIAPRKIPKLEVITAVEAASKFLTPENATQWRK
jgi:hypothetical protein